MSELPCNYRCQQLFHSHSQPFVAAHTQINEWEGTCTSVPGRKRHNVKKAVQPTYTSEWVALQYRRQHSHSQPSAAAHEQINGWKGTCLQALVTLTMLQFHSSGKGTLWIKPSKWRMPSISACWPSWHGNQDRAEELPKDQQLAMSEDIIETFWSLISWLFVLDVEKK